MIEKIIKIRGKTSFEQLTLSEISEMIRADSAISRDGNDNFSSSALDIFLNNGNKYKSSELEMIRAEILDRIYMEGCSLKEKK